MPTVFFRLLCLDRAHRKILFYGIHFFPDPLLYRQQKLSIERTRFACSMSSGMFSEFITATISFRSREPFLFASAVRKASSTHLNRFFPHINKSMLICNNFCTLSKWHIIISIDNLSHHNMTVGVNIIFYHRSSNICRHCLRESDNEGFKEIAVLGDRALALKATEHYKSRIKQRKKHTYRFRNTATV